MIMVKVRKSIRKFLALHLHHIDSSIMKCPFNHGLKSMYLWAFIQLLADAWIEFVQSQVFLNSSLSFSKYLINFVYGNFEKSSEDDIFKTTLVYFCFEKKCIRTSSTVYYINDEFKNNQDFDTELTSYLILFTIITRN